VQVNAESQGILDQLHVSVGSQVQAGDLIAVLADPNLRVEYAKKKIEAQSVHESIRAEQAQGKLAELQNAQSRLESLHVQLGQLESRIQRLEVRAPQDGVVVHLSVNNCIGKKVDSGESICMLAQSRELEAKVSASQRDFEPFHNSIGQPVLIQCVGLAQQLGTIGKVDPKGSLYLSDPLLAGCYNGPIPVELESSPSSSTKWKLSAPRFDIHIRIPTDSALVPGQLVWVKVPGQSTGILGVVSSWLKNQWNSLRAQLKSQA
jgi:multidrug resistance efflux pump